MTILETDSKEISSVLCQLTNLRSLELYHIKIELDLKLIFTQLRYLRYLNLSFDDNQATIDNLN